MTERGRRPPAAVESALEPLLELARAELGEAAPRRHAASLAQVQLRLERRSARRKRAALGAALAAALVFGGLGLYAGSGPEPLGVEVVAGELAPGGAISPSPDATRIRFSDGTELAVEADARAQVAQVRADGADIRLDQGQVRLQVTRRPGARWNVLAGAYRVHVTGTSFAVAHDRAADTLDVELFSGSVRVTGPLLDTGVEVTAAHKLSIDGKRGRVRVESTANVSSASLEEPPATLGVSPDADAAAPTPEAEASPQPPAAPVPRTRASGPKPPSWASRVSAGKFDEVLRAAEQRGLDEVYERASASDLQALADAARYARKNAIARDALLAMRRRLPGSERARQAAFFLGRLAEPSGDSSALSWYERYLAEEPRGTHASQALGRKMLIVQRRAGFAAAAPIAREYLKRFPEGPHAASARSIVAGR